MADLYVLVSNPPHGTVDATALGRHFGLAAAEARIRANFPAPSIWDAGAADAMRETGTTLQRSGARLKLINGAMLARIPEPDEVREFRFEAERLVYLSTTGAKAAIPYPARTVLVSAQPHTRIALGVERAKPKPRGQIGADIAVQLGGNFQEAAPPEDPDAEWHDLFFVGKNMIKRAGIRPSTIRFTGLGTERASTYRENMGRFLTRVETYFPNLTRDRRLVGVPAPKPWPVGGRSVAAVLEAIQPTLRTLSSTELQTRLAFLTTL